MPPKGKKKAKKEKNTSSNEKGASSNNDSEPADVDGLLQQARHAVETLEPELAVKFYQRALERAPDNPDVLDEASDLMMQMGMMDEAKGMLEKSIHVAPDAHAGKWLYLAQLTGGAEALALFEKGQALLMRDLELAVSEETKQTLLTQLCTSFCSVGELYMTDLCMEDDAEACCEAALEKALANDYGGPEPQQALANLRLSQGRPAEALQSVRTAVERMADMDPLPDYDFRMSMVKVLIECSDETQGAQTHPCELALDVLSRLMQEDDENVEVWYLMGVCFYKMEPPDLAYAKAHLERALEMLDKIKEALEQQQEAFPYADQVRLVSEQLQLVETAEAELPAGEDDGDDAMDDAD